MHDPQTVAFEIKSPWRSGRSELFPKGRRQTWITIWHVDPESDGSDDSCGFSRARIPKDVLGELAFSARQEAQYPWFLRAAAAVPPSAVEAECLLRGALLEAAASCRLKLSLEEASRLAVRLLHNPVDNLRSSLCFLPGYHSNFDEDREGDREEHALWLYRSLARCLLTDARPWYRHPRWHFWHWKIQVHALQRFQRWAFSRCCRCGGRFRYGESPTTNSWHHEGPRWFRGEQDVYHSNCNGSPVEAKAAR